MFKFGNLLPVPQEDGLSMDSVNGTYLVATVVAVPEVFLCLYQDQHSFNHSR